jgi:short-chain fatty acids transporter
MEPKIARFSNLFVNAADRWLPDSYVFVLAVVVLVGLAAFLHGASPFSVSRAFGDGLHYPHGAALPHFLVRHRV